MMGSIWHGKQWTEDEVDAIAKEAVRKKYEADAAMAAAADIEVEYWTRDLIERFPVLKSDYDENTIDVCVSSCRSNDQDFLCTVTWSNKTEICIISEPERPYRYGTTCYPHATVKVWWQRAKKSKNPEFLKDYGTVRCSEIIPFITALEPIIHRQAKKDGLLKGPPETATQAEE
jgi:hypothetical protein